MSESDEAKPVAEIEGAASPATPLEPPARPADPAPPAPRRGGFWGGLMGGLLAGGIGYGAGHLWPVWSGSDARIAGLEAEIAALKTSAAPGPDLGAVEARIAALEAVPTPAAPDLSGLEARLDGLEQALAAQGGTGDGAALAALRAEVDRLKATAPGAVDTTALRAETEALLAKARTEAEAIAAAARRAAALDRLRAAADSGAPFAAARADLGDLPPTLASLAETGIPSLASLRASFPDAARAGLEAAIRADMGESWTERALSFLQTTTGARSLAPREGNDPDAILSRAEAALTAGDLDASLAEIASLPAVAQEAMTGWTETAKERQTALAEVAALAGGQGN